MTVRLSVRTASWRSHVAQMVASTPGLVPVVKGNGYGFGRAFLAGVAAEFADTVAVGTVHELGDLPDTVDPVVLTPTLHAPASTRPILTVGRIDHLQVLERWTGRVIVKLRTDLRRYGGEPEMIDAARDAGHDVIGVALHPPIAGSEDERVEQVVRALGAVPDDLEVWVSHLGPEAYASLPGSHRYRIRIGTSLWHGDKSALHLDADVLNVREVEQGETAGYRLGEMPSDGHLVMIGAGTANGVTPLPDGRSPFHFGRVRMALHEPPHMHTSMVFVPHGDPLPEIGDWVDVQRPLHMTSVDVLEWS
jgi:alanine racemase